jgi:hypothetical protein
MTYGLWDEGYVKGLEVERDRYKAALDIISDSPVYGTEPMELIQIAKAALTK